MAQADGGPIPPRPAKIRAAFTRGQGRIGTRNIWACAKASPPRPGKRPEREARGCCSSQADFRLPAKIGGGGDSRIGKVEKGEGGFRIFRDNVAGEVVRGRVWRRNERGQDRSKAKGPTRICQSRSPGRPPGLARNRAKGSRRGRSSRRGAKPGGPATQREGASAALLKKTTQT